jgi:outer membrane protein
MKRLFVLSILVLSLLVQVQGTGRAEDGSPASPGNKAPSTPVGTPESVVTLARGLQLVTSESHDVLITQEGELLALADLHLARSGFFPTINGSGSHTSLEYQVAGVTNAASPIVNRQGLVVGQGTQRLVVPQVPTDYWSFSASVQQTLFDFWRTIGLYKANKEFLSNSKLDTARVKNLTALQFTTAYFDLLEAEKVVTVAQQEVDRLEAHRRDAQNLYTSGAITKNDLLQAQVRLTDGTQRVLNANNLRALRASRVNNLLVRPLTRPLQVVDIEFKPEPPPFTLEEAWDRAMQDRPEIQIVTGSLKALHLLETARKADYYPTIFVRGGVDFSHNQFVFHQTNYSATVGMTVNLFSGGATSAAVAKIQYQQDQALKQRDKLEDDIRLEVQRFVLDLNNARARIDVNRDAAQQAQENLRINKVRYDAGEGIATEVLDAVTLLTTAETNYIRAIYDFRRSEAGMFYAVGKDLREVYKQ